LVDIDAIRDSMISATDEERAKALGLRNEWHSDSCYTEPGKFMPLASRIRHCIYS